MPTFAVCRCGQDATEAYRWTCGPVCMAVADVEETFSLPRLPFSHDTYMDLRNYIESALENVDSPDEVGEHADYWASGEHIQTVLESISTLGLWDYEVPEGVRTFADAARWILYDFLSDVAHHVLSMDLRGDA